MSVLKRLRSWLTWMIKRPRLERKMETEVRFHIDSFAEDLIRSGVPEPEARRRARIEFGGIESHKDAVRASLGLRWWDELWADLRYALRMMRRNPGFTAVAVLSLALGVCANTTIFSAINALLFRRLPYQNNDRLVGLLNRSFSQRGIQGVSTGDLANWRKQNSVFDQIEVTSTLHRRTCW